MKISFDKYPVDIILCILYSLILLPMSLLDIGGILRIVLGLPFILFIPGYLLIFVLFPARKTDEGITVIERIALSFGISMAVVALIEFALNDTSWRIQSESGPISIFVFVIGIGAISLYRWFKTASDERFTVSIDLSLLKSIGKLKSKSKLDKTLIIILIASIIITAALFIYVMATPRTGEKFTAIYLLGPDGTITNYPMTLSTGENATIIIGVTNHEYRTIDYTIEIWLIKQTTFYNESTNENEDLYINAWFIDKINVTLDPESIDANGLWKPQWEYNHTFNIDKAGEDFKLAFLLFTTPTEDYSYDKDYKNIMKQKINSAYNEVYLWIDVT